MTFGLLVAGFLGTANAGRVALAFGDARPSRRALASLLAVGAVLVVVCAAVADPLLDALDISPESFRIAAGLVLAVAGLATIARPRAAGPLAAVLVTPELASFAIAASADEGVGPALGAAAIALAAVAAVALLPGPAAAGRAAPFIAALAVVVGVALVVSGVRDV